MIIDMLERKNVLNLKYLSESKSSVLQTLKLFRSVCHMVQGQDISSYNFSKVVKIIEECLADESFKSRMEPSLMISVIDSAYASEQLDELAEKVRDEFNANFNWDVLKTFDKDKAAAEE